MILNDPAIDDRVGFFCVAARTWLISVAVSAFIIWLPQLASAQGPSHDLSQNQDQAQPDFSSRISGFELRRLDPGVELWVESTGALELVGIEIKRPNRMVLQLPRHRAPSHLLEGSFEGDLISNGTFTVQESDRGPLTKISFSVRPGSRHALSTEGNILRLKLRPSDFQPVVVSDLDQIRRQADVLRDDLRKSEAARRMLTENLTIASTDNQTLRNRFEQLEVRRRSLETGLSTALSEFSRL